MTHNFFQRSPHGFFVQSPHGFRNVGGIGTICAISHHRQTTAEGSGHVTRIDPDDGSVMWTTDLGDWNGDSAYPRLVGKLVINSTGRIYVAWWVDRPSGAAPCGGVSCLDSDGTILWQTDFPNSTFSTPEIGVSIPLPLAIDPNDESRIFVGASVVSGAGDNVLVYVVDSDGNIIGSRDLDLLTSPRFCAALAIDQDSNLWAFNYVSSISWDWTKFDDAGVVIYSESSTLWGLFLRGTALATLCDPFNDALIYSASAGASTPATDVFQKLLADPSGATTAAAAHAWQLSFNDLGAPTPALDPGAWSSIPGSMHAMAIISSGVNVAIGASAAAWNPDVPGPNVSYHLTVLSRDLGAKQYFSTLDDQIRIWDLACDENNTFVAACEASAATLTGTKHVFRLSAGDGSTIWSVNPFTNTFGSTRVVYGIDVRTV